MCADAREARGYREALGEDRAQLLLTDPPYCLLTRRRKGGDLRDGRNRKIDRDPVLRFETVRDYRTFTAAWMGEAVRWLTGPAPLIIWTNFLGKAPIFEAAAALGYGQLWGEFVWGKRSREGGGNEQLVRVYEVALVLGRVPLRPPSVADAPVPWSVVTGYDDEGEGGQWGHHPHHKPHSALEPLVRLYSRPGELILDPFAGSGSIPASALKLGRDVACLELRPDWAAQVTERITGALP
ncbi:MAG TPA: DNA methyltransferase [Myxococcaceae bacterium]|nr:DNA methyltransferase [Myxococcaceae bacterium]